LILYVNVEITVYGTLYSLYIHTYTKRYNVHINPEDLKANKTCKYFINKILIKQDTEEIQDGGEQR